MGLVGAESEFLKAAPALSVEIKLLFNKIGGINLPALSACCDRI